MADPVEDAPSCGTCRFSDLQVMEYNADGLETPTPVLNCKRYPPLPVIVFETTDGSEAIPHPILMRPQVDAPDWCGEWRGMGGEVPVWDVS